MCISLICELLKNAILYVKLGLKKHPSIDVWKQVSPTLLLLNLTNSKNYLSKEDKLNISFLFNINNITTSVELPKTLEELSKKPLLLPVKTTNQRKKIEEVLNNKGITTDPIMELETNEMMLNYIKEGMGVGYILKSVALKNPDLQIVELEEELPSEIITLVFNETTLTSSSKEFINMLTNMNL